MLIKLKRFANYVRLVYSDVIKVGDNIHLYNVVEREGLNKPLKVATHQKNSPCAFLGVCCVMWNTAPHETASRSNKRRDLATPWRPGANL
ncbi:hypothetical protein AVEN_217725-1 [Araneus ventricosus]|uniref:Uncharacterized protein n=1 Tax=Araneus ventricosus TaxID=182803 RepID=A0A4Y2NJU8_ARAVE|nr:hypothetical protein AVEN_217725-1 [Araneus ventricosus]